MFHLLTISGLFNLRVVDLVDIILFAILLYEVYNLVKGTAAIRIFIGIIAVYLIWKVVKAFQMQLLSEILGQFISVGVIALVVVFQPEIRQFLLMLGNTRIIHNRTRRFLFWKLKVNDPFIASIDIIVMACQKMAEAKTGALIVIARESQLASFIETGQLVGSRISEIMLESIFFKNGPLHDGAVVIVGDTIMAARCILPVSKQSSIPSWYGLRHRAAIGLTEKSDAIAIVISEERGTISYSMDGKMVERVSASELSEFLVQTFNK
ncbi:MAG: diadenylate cyclase CdaA [Bacteroidetes bacterium]|nr:diadenylate cyclase CdaA [Bacteroidota bacterium]